MPYFFKSHKRPSFFDPVSRARIKVGHPLKLETIPTSSYFTTALRGQWIIKCTEEEYNEILGITPEPPPPPELTPKEKLMQSTKKEILKKYDWMDEEDLAEAGKKKNKEAMVDFLLEIEEEYK